MRKNIIKSIGVIVFSFIMIFNVQYIFRVDENVEKLGFRIGQNEALAADYNYKLEIHPYGCICEPYDGLFCVVSAQCLCRWGGCWCCIKVE